MSTPLPFEPPAESPKRPLRPLHGIPEPERRTRTGWFVSGLLHAIILTALLLPPLVGRILEETAPGGAGGPGPSGGGGGGMGGTGGVVTPERIRYLDVAPPAATASPPPPVERPTPTPTPVPPPPPEPQPEPQAAQVQEAPPAPPSAGTTVPSAGSGGGSGKDGSGGNGPGSGGGVGSGIGTGRGSGIGPGTGGGNDQIFPPTVTNLAILPIPVPARVRPYRLVAHFDVDERGNARLIGFNPSRDRGYNNKIREMLAEVRFRPATRADGTPVRDTAVITAEAPD